MGQKRHAALRLVLLYDSVFDRKIIAWENVTSMKILIIDDNTTITEMLSKFLQVKGFDCVTSNDGRNGLTLMKKEKFHTVFLDMSMPEFGGKDVIEALEKDNLLKDQRIIIFTASSISNDEVDELIKKDGVESCLRKPVQLSELITTINAGN